MCVMFDLFGFSQFFSVLHEIIIEKFIDHCFIERYEVRKRT